MENIIVKDLVNATGGKLVFGNENEVITGIATDSRKTVEGDLYVAIIGEVNDGHKFIDGALKFATAALISKKPENYIEGKSYILVDETEEALKLIGKYVRERYTVPFIGVTGSVGKTTTREMVTCALAANKEVYHTSGNMNSQIGVPITLSGMKSAAELAVIEMGISEEGHMNKLTNMVKPDIAVVTMIGVAHIEFMKTRECIRREKLKICERMSKDNVIFLNGDDELLAEVKTNPEIIREINPDVQVKFYGTSDWCDYIAKDIVMEGLYSTYTYYHNGEEISVKLKSPGKHNVLNSLAGLAVSDYLGLDVKNAAKAYEEFTGLRLKVLKSEKGYTVIDDTYNASPDSMKASVNVLADYRCRGRKIAVLGDMYELGENTLKFHYEVGEYVATKNIDELITIGEYSVEIAKGLLANNADIKVTTFAKKDEATEYIKSVIKEEDAILLKASNGMKLSIIVEELV